MIRDTYRGGGDVLMVPESAHVDDHTDGSDHENEVENEAE